jgi:eukaryotic-like serine/threonine-protein kinase
VVGHYEIVSALGAGGMGEVFLARDTRLNRQVAIKLLLQSSLDEESQKRMLREARMVATIDHPNVCTIFEIGDDNGRPYIVMQYVQGESLSDRLSKGPMNAVEATAAARQIAAALAEAHGRGIVHRDVKPGNVMIGSGGFVKVLDFGLAKTFVEQDLAGPTELMISTPGLVAGTIPYMSPEQLRAEPLDGRSDVFSLGIMLYEMIAGRRPFDRPTAAATISAILHEDPAPLKTGSTALDRLIARALTKQVTRRATAVELLEAFDTIGRRKPRTAAAHTKTEKVAAGGGQIRSLAILPLDAAIADENLAYLEEGLLERMIARLSHVPKLRVIAQGTVMRYRGRDVAHAEIARQLGVDALITGRVAASMESLKLQLQMNETASDRVVWRAEFERSGREVEALAVEVAAQVADTIRQPTTTGGSTSSRRRTARPAPAAVDPAAEKLYLRGRIQWNKRHPEAVRRAIASFQEALEIDPTYAIAHAGLADVYLMLAFLQALPTSDAIPKAKAAALRAIELDPSLAEPHASLGYAAGFMEWDWPVAERELKEAMRLNPNYSWAPHWYGLQLAPRGSFESSLHHLTLARDLDPLSPIITAAIGSPYHLHRRFQEAVRIYANVLDSEPAFAPAHFYIGQSYEQLGRYDDAQRHMNRAGEIAGDDATFAGSIGHCYARSGDRAAAEDLLASLHRRAAERYTSPYHFMLINLGLGRFEEALTWLEQALDQHTSWLYLTPRDPRLDPLRGLTAFRDMVARYGLAPSAD